MSAVQLEFNIENKTEIDMMAFLMQKQIDAMHESMGKVRKKLFSQMGELQKLCLSIQEENETIKKMLRELKNEKTHWIYAQENNLFDVREVKEAVG